MSENQFPCKEQRSSQARNSSRRYYRSHRCRKTRCEEIGRGLFPYSILVQYLGRQVWNRYHNYNEGSTRRACFLVGTRSKVVSCPTINLASIDLLKLLSAATVASPGTATRVSWVWLPLQYPALEFGSNCLQIPPIYISSVLLEMHYSKHMSKVS